MTLILNIPNYSFKNLKDKAIFFKSMAKNKIYLQVHYIPIYRHPFFKRFNFKISNFTNCEKFYKNIFSLPMHLNLTFKDIDFICKKLSTFLK